MVSMIEWCMHCIGMNVEGGGSRSSSSSSEQQAISVCVAAGCSLMQHLACSCT